MKIRKNQRRKKFRFHINRKKMRVNQAKLHKTEWDLINETWVKNKSAKQNLEAMGLVYDPNVTFKIPTVKEMLTPPVLGAIDVEMPEVVKETKPVAAALEKFANMPRKKEFKLPNNEFQWIAYLVERHGEDYKAMSKDSKNVYQDTWRQIRAKINKFVASHPVE